MTAFRAQSGVVVRTRLRPPVPHLDDVRRTRLLGWLDATCEPVILVAAPRGAGKTVLLAQWADSRRCAWVSLSSHDDSPAGVWSALLESVRPYCAGVPAPPAALLDDEATLFTEVLPELLNVLAAARPLVLVLDGLDVIDHPVTRATLDEFVRRIPGTVRIVLATARPAAGPVAALRAAGRLAELDEDDLRLDLAETRQLLATMARRPVGAAEASALWHDYDGWATGVRLAGLALRDQPAGTRLPRPVASVEDFFRAEVLERVTSRQRRLLLYSSVLEELTPDRCGEVTEVPAAGETLAALAASSLLLRRTGPALRCHPVLRLVLRSVLAAEQPGAVAALQARAARRLGREGDLDAAYEHARLAGLDDVALRAAVEAWPAAHPRTVLARLDQLPGAALSAAAAQLPAAGTDGVAGADAVAAAAEVRAIAGASAIAAAAELARGNSARAAARLVGEAGRLSLAGTADRPALAGTADPPALAVRAWLALQRGDLAVARADATRVVGTVRAAGPPRLTGERSWWLALADAALGTTAVWDGRAADAVAGLAATAQEAAAAGYTDAAVRALDARVAGLLLTGDPTAALAAAREAVAWHEPDPTRCVAPVIAYACLTAVEGAGLGAIRWSAGDALPAPHAEAFALLLLAQAAGGGSGDARRARCTRAQAQAALAGLRPGPVLGPLLEGEGTAGIPDLRPATLSARERAVLRALSGPLTLREIAAELNLSHNTVKTHVRSVFRKLDAHDRGGAVTRGAAAGLATRKPSEVLSWASSRW